MSPERIRRIYEERRDWHHELLFPLDMTGLLRILEREGVTLFHVPLPRPAQLVQFCGAWAILLDSQRPRRRDLFYACHELAHLWLHVDACGLERTDVIYNLEDLLTPGDAECDADYLATLMLDPTLEDPRCV